MAKMTLRALVFLFALALLACNGQEPGMEQNEPPVSFHPETLRIPDAGGRKIRGQVLYMPIYSNIPFREEAKFDLSAFVAIHNTDLTHPITLTKVDFFNTDGKVVKRFLTGEQRIAPLATAVFTISQKDQSGTGANFLVEWIGDQPVNEPLVESIMKDLSGNLGLSFLSQGRVIREMK